MSQGMASPAASNWPNSPGMPRPSPARSGQSPGTPSHLAHSPDHKNDMWQQSRNIPPRLWAGAVPTVVTYKSLDILCRPCCTPAPGPNSPPPSLPQGTPELCPLERFLGCVYMRRQMHRFIQAEDTVRHLGEMVLYRVAYSSLKLFCVLLQLIDLRTTEPGFKTESLQCCLIQNPHHLQTLHMKVTALLDNKDHLTIEEIQVNVQIILYKF